MTPTQQALLNAHVKFELSRIDTQLNEDITNTVNGLFDTFNDTTLQDWITPDAAKDFAVRFISEAKYKKPSIKVIQKIISAIYQHPLHDTTSVTDLISDDQVEAYVATSLGLPNLREDIIHATISSETYHEVIAELLYSGIVGYLTEGNVITEKVPGAKTMMKMGKGLLNKAAPKLEERVESQVKKFISTNLGDVVQQSESILLDAINTDQLSTLYMIFWKELGKHTIAEGKPYLPEDAVQAYAELIYADFQTLKANTYITELTATGIDAFFKYYGKKKMSVLCAEWDVTPKKVIAFCAGTVPQIISGLQESGYLETWVTERLTAFYCSEEALKALES